MLNSMLSPVPNPVTPSIFSPPDLGHVKTLNRFWKNDMSGKKKEHELLMLYWWA